MHMLQNLHLAANPVSVFIEAIRGVGMQLDFRLGASKHRFRLLLGGGLYRLHRLRGLFTGQPPVPGIAVIRMLMVAVNSAG